MRPLSCEHKLIVPVDNEITPMPTPITQLHMRPLHIPFTQAFRHSSAVRAETEAVWVEASTASGLTGYGEGCPRDYVTGETVAGALAFFAAHQEMLAASVHDLASLRRWMDTHQAGIDANPAAWCAIELALLDLFAKVEGISVERLLDAEELKDSFRYTAVLGDASAQAFQAMLGRYAQWGFTDYKLKLSGDLSRDREKIAAIKTHAVDGLRVRLDANNLWESPASAADFVRALDYPFFAIEEPLRPAGRYQDLARLGESLKLPVILDESFLRLEQFAALHDAAQRWIINLRVSKMGGILRSLAIAETAGQLGIPLIVGAQVGETSVLTRAALTVANRAEPLAQEGAFGTLLLTRDVCEPSLMFGAGGILRTGEQLDPEGGGFGLRIRNDAIAGQ